MNLNLKGKVAVVTGASKGIGAGIAQALAAEGVTVVVNYVNSQTDASRVVAAIEAAGGRATAVQADVSKAADVARLFEATQQAYGQVDILVNNAATFEMAPVETVTEETFHHHFTTNVWSLFLTTQAALPYFKQGGSIVNISSIAGLNPPANASLYAATKAAGDAVTVSLAKELGPRGIRVNTVAPGPTNTEGIRRQGQVSPGTPGEQFVVQLTPLGRLGEPADIAAVVTFLVSDAAGWVTGECLRASGGMQ